MARKRKKTINKKKPSWLFLLLLPIIALTVVGLTQQQRIQQFAASVFNGPPLYGCLQVGEGKSENCGTRLGEDAGQSYKLNGRPFTGEMVYYGDTFSGSYTYKNTEDLPLNIKYMGIAGGATRETYYMAFEPLKESITIAPGETVTYPEGSYTFRSPDPSEGWVIGPGLTNTEGQPLPIEKGINIRVSAACTALRFKPLTAADKQNIQALCASNPNNKLCQSKQYCEIFKGGNCPQPVLGEDIAGQQCDEHVVLEQKEQDILEELCKVYPNTDACKNFCNRTIGSKICPPKIIWVDNRTGQQVFPQKAQYKAMSSEKTVAGAQTSESADITNEETTEQDAIEFGINTPLGCIGSCVHLGQTLAANWAMITPLGCLGNCASDAAVAGVQIAQKAPINMAPIGDGGASKARSGGGTGSKAKSGAPASGGGGTGSKAVKKGAPGEPGYQPSCRSHRANNDGQCCTSGYPLINGCCQPGCFVYHSEPESRSNCRYKNKSGRCCNNESVERLGYCQPNQAPRDVGGTPVNPNVPRDPKIFPPNALPPAGSQPARGGGNKGNIGQPIAPPGGGNPGVGVDQIDPRINHDERRSRCASQGGTYNPYNPDVCNIPEQGSGRTEQQRSACENARRSEVNGCVSGCNNDYLGIPGLADECMNRCDSIRDRIQRECR